MKNKLLFPRVAFTGETPLTVEATVDEGCSFYGQIILPEKKIPVLGSINIMLTEDGTHTPMDVYKYMFRKRNGRPANDEKAVARALYEYMCQIAAKAHGISVKQLRLEAAQFVGMHHGDPRTIERNMRKALNKRAIGWLTEFSRCFFAPGDLSGRGRFSLFFHETRREVHSPEKIRISGMCWACKWGEKSAHLLDGVLEITPH